MAHTPTKLASPLEVTGGPLRRGSTVHGPPSKHLSSSSCCHTPAIPGRVGLKGSVRTSRSLAERSAARTSPTPGQRCVECGEGPSNNFDGPLWIAPHPMGKANAFSSLSWHALQVKVRHGEIATLCSWRHKTSGHSGSVESSPTHQQTSWDTATAV